MSAQMAPKVAGVELMATAEQRVDDSPFNAYAFTGRSDGTGSTMLDLPGFDGSHIETEDGIVHYKVAKPDPSNPLAPHITQQLIDALDQLKDVTWEFIAPVE